MGRFSFVQQSQEEKCIIKGRTHDFLLRLILDERRAIDDLKPSLSESNRATSGFR